MKNKKTLTMAVSAALAAVLVIGGTFAYLQDVSDPVRNEFEKNKVEVSLVETTDGYEIIPGTEQEKDPKVSGEATLPAYVFVQVEDETDDLVSYEIADGWTLLEEGVYYREVPKGHFGPFSVLKDDKVSYSEDITNADMGDLEENAALTFTSYAIQKAPFADAAAAWAEIQAEQNADVELPDATLEVIDPVVIGTVKDIDESWEGNLDQAAKFSTPDLPADIEEAEYKDWKVDFLLSFNKDVDGEVVHLFGQYGSYGWLGDDLKAGGIENLAAGEELAIMKDWFGPAVGMGDGQITYADVVNFVNEFNCGVFVDDDELKEGLTATLKLVMTDGDGAKHVVDTADFTF